MRRRLAPKWGGGDRQKPRGTVREDKEGGGGEARVMEQVRSSWEGDARGPGEPRGGATARGLAGGEQGPGRGFTSGLQIQPVAAAVAVAAAAQREREWRRRRMRLPGGGQEEAPIGPGGRM